MPLSGALMCAGRFGEPRFRCLLVPGFAVLSDPSEWECGMHGGPEFVTISAQSQERFYALVFMWGYIGGSLTLVAEDFRSATTETERERIGEKLSECARVMSLPFDDLVAWAHDRELQR
jgi:hypothetical protein